MDLKTQITQRIQRSYLIPEEQKKNFIEKLPGLTNEQLKKLSDLMNEEVNYLQAILKKYAEKGFSKEFNKSLGQFLYSSTRKILHAREIDVHSKETEDLNQLIESI